MVTTVAYFEFQKRGHPSFKIKY